jgi:hypothetical protein
MDKLFQNANPRALNLNAIKNCTSKVTLGFKCKPLLKIKLAEHAALNGSTLSAYTEMLLTNAEQKFEYYKKEILRLKSSSVNLQSKVDFYESPTLVKLFQNNKNQVLAYKNAEGKEVVLKVETLQDVYTIIINSFK